MESYRQYCPVALTAEVVGRRWTPLILRELLLGSVRFNDIHRGVSRMSRTLLSTRLEELEAAGILERRAVEDHPEYHLTEAGEELQPVIMGMARWGKRWLEHRLSRTHVDANHLMWDVHRGIEVDATPPGRLVLHFHFPDDDQGYGRYWLVVEDGAVDVCVDDPGYDVDLRLVCEVRTLADVWIGDRTLREALRAGDIRLKGPRELRRRLPDWLGLSPLADVERAR